jgi:biotin carboxyl carrier protein
MARMSEPSRGAPGAPAMIAGLPHGARAPSLPDPDDGLPALIDPSAVRASVAATTRLEGDPTLTVEPLPDPAGRLPGMGDPGAPDPGAGAVIDGTRVAAAVARLDGARARLTAEGIRTDVLFGPVRRDAARGVSVREVVVSGWRFEIELEPERRAALRERARRAAGVTGRGGPVEVRAIIPGRVVAVLVVPGDAIEAGQQVLVVEAMKMQNELRAPREGTVERVGVRVGDTIEVGDLLVIIH